LVRQAASSWSGNGFRFRHRFHALDELPKNFRLLWRLRVAVGAWGRKFLKAGDEIVLTEMEHHSNMVPWQLLAKEKSLVLKYVSVELDGTLNMDKVRATLGPKTKLFSFVAISNALGTVNPVTELVKLGRAVGAAVLVDACQWAPHRAMDVTAWGCDFVAFSAHKMLGPTGIGFSGAARSCSRLWILSWAAAT